MSSKSVSHWTLAVRLVVILQITTTGVFGAPAKVESNKESNASECEQRIIDGEPSSRGKWPWVVAIDSNEYGFICGGTLINVSWVMTAAHCVDGAPVTLYAKVGAFNITGTDEVDRIAVSQIIVHEEYDSGKNGLNDVALLKLERPAGTTNPCVQPITLPHPFYSFSSNSLCWIVGWGRTDTNDPNISPVLTQKRVTTIKNTECQNRWNAAITKPEIRSSNLCIDEEDGTVSACFGDSGSPVHCFSLLEWKWLFAGLSSWGSAACRVYPSVYMRTTSYLDWIQDVTAD